MARLHLPFYAGVDARGGQTRLDLYEIAMHEAVPVDEGESFAVWRWSHFLWNGEDPPTALDWDARTIHGINARIGIDLGEADSDERIGRVLLYQRFFCAFITASIGEGEFRSPFLIVTDRSDFPWLAQTGDIRLRPVSLAPAPAQPEFGDGAAVFVTPGIRSADAVVMHYLGHLFSVQLRTRFSKPSGDGRFYHAIVDMLEDETIAESDPAGDLPYASTVSRAGILTVVSSGPVVVTASIFANLLLSGFLDDAGGRDVAGSAPAESTRRRIAALRRIGVPRKMIHIQVRENLDLRALGAEVPHPVGSAFRVTVEGDVHLRDMIFRSSVTLKNWTIRGALLGAHSRFGSGLTLEAFHVLNAFGPQEGLKPEARSAMGLQEIRVDGAFVLEGVKVVGGLSLRDARLEGRARLTRVTATGGEPASIDASNAYVAGSLRLEHVHAGSGIDLSSARVGADASIESTTIGPAGTKASLAADRLSVGGLLELAGLTALGPVSLKDVRVQGSLDLSGIYVKPEIRTTGKSGYGEDGVLLNRAWIDGDLVVNRHHACFTWNEVTQTFDCDPEKLTPALIGGALDLTDAKVGGSVEIVCTHVGGALSLAGARIGRSVAITGLQDFDRTAQRIALPARATFVKEGITLDQATIGGALRLDGTVTPSLALNGLTAEFVFARPDDGSGLPLHLTAATPFALSTAKVSVMELGGLQAGGGLHAVGLSAAKRLRLCSARVVRAASSPKFPEEVQALFEAWGSCPPEEARGRFRRAADAARAGTPTTTDDRVILPTRILGVVHLWELKCDGNVELWDPDIGRHRPDDRRNEPVLWLRNPVIEGGLALHSQGMDPADRPDAAKEDLRHTVPSGAVGASVNGALRIEGAKIHGRTNLAHATVRGTIEIRDSALTGGLAAEDLEAETEHRAGLPFEVSNVRAGADLVLLGTRIGQCTVRDSTIEGDLLLSHDAETPPQGLARSRPAMLQGALRIEGATVAGRTDLTGATVLEALEIRDSDLTGGLAARNLSVGSEGQPRAAFVINNIRARADILLGGIRAGECTIRDCTVEGDLLFSHGEETPLQKKAGRERAARLINLRVEGNRIDGVLRLSRLEVEQAIDLSGTSALGGLAMGQDEDAARRPRGGAYWRRVVADRLILTRFHTEADADLRQLVLREPAAATPGIGEDGRQWWNRIKDDLLLDDGLSPEGGAGKNPHEMQFREEEAGTLLAQHARIAGALSLPDSEPSLARADLSFAHAGTLNIVTKAFRPLGRNQLAIRICNSDIGMVSARGTLAYPNRIDMRDATVQHLRRAEDKDRSGEELYRHYSQLLDRSWPFAQGAYSRIEEDFRNEGLHREADRIMKRMGWRLWRRAYLRPVLMDAPDIPWHELGMVLFLFVLGQALLQFGWPGFWRGLLLLLILSGVFLLLPEGGKLRLLTGPARLTLGLVLFVFHWVYGFGVRWWLPPAVSLVLLLGVTAPMMGDCANLALIQSGDRQAPACTASPGETPRIDGTEWTYGEALWLGIRYHLPIVPFEGFYSGERPERVRPSGTPARFRLLGADLTPGQFGVDLTPEQYARAVYLTSWVIVPFSLIFVGARIHRRYRLQK